MPVVHNIIICAYNFTILFEIYSKFEVFSNLRVIVSIFLKVGDFVKISGDMERVKELQSGHGEWVDSMIHVRVIGVQVLSHILGAKPPLLLYTW